MTPPTLPVGQDAPVLPALEHRVRTGSLRRVAAIGALALGLVGLAVSVVAVLSEPLIAVATGAAGFLALTALFWFLTSEGRSRLVAGIALALTLGVVAWAAVAWIVRPEGDEPALLVGLAALAVAGALGRYALRVPPRLAAHADVRVGAGPCRRPVLLCNPHSGGGKVERFGVVEACERLGIEAVVLHPGDDLVALARDAVGRGADALGSAGGDGSLGLVAAVALEHDLPFVCVPAGTRNHFALDLGLDRDDPLAALAAFTVGEEHRIDHATVNGRVFLNNVALGVYAAVVARPEYRGAKVATALAALPGLVDKGDPAYDLALDVPGAGHWDQAALVMVSNGPYELSPPRAFARRLHLDGGRLGVIAVDVDGAGSLASVTALAALSGAERSAWVWPWATDELVVDSPHDEVPAGIDGEAVRLRTPVTLRSVPGALRVLVPPSTRIGLARQDRSLETGAVAGLLDVLFAGDEDD